MAPCLLLVSHQPTLWHLDAARGPSTPSLDHLVSAREDARWNGEPQRRGGLEINDQLILSRRLHRKVGWLFALKDAVDVASSPAVLVEQIWTIGDQAAGGDIGTGGVDCGQSVPGR